MNIETSLKILLCLITCTPSLPVFAQDNGCLFQGSFTDSGASGAHEVVNTCAANKGMTEEHFKMVCKSLSNSYSANRNNSPDDLFTMKMASSCPEKIEAECTGAFGEKMSLLYMAGDSSLDDGQGEVLCKAGDGKWQPR